MEENSRTFQHYVNVNQRRITPHIFLVDELPKGRGSALLSLQMQRPSSVPGMHRNAKSLWLFNEPQMQCNTSLKSTHCILCCTFPRLWNMK